MPINLHERLSEFSYGYGVTREVEDRIRARGLRVTPFLPNLVQEASLGFDVAFNLPGTAILLQFKLGEELKKFRSSASVPVAPHPMSRPFWRYKIDTAEDQFRNLVRWERRGADVYYASPRFSAWFQFDLHFRSSAVLSSSLLIRPREVRNALIRQRSGAGVHRILYDRRRRYVCSEPEPIGEISPDELVVRAEDKVRKNKRSLGERLKFISRRPERDGQPLGRSRISEIQERAKTEADANAAIFGIEAWSRGAQLLFVTES